MVITSLIRCGRPSFETPRKHQLWPLYTWKVLRWRRSFYNVLILVSFFRMERRFGAVLHAAILALEGTGIAVLHAAILALEGTGITVTRKTWEVEQKRLKPLKSPKGTNFNFVILQMWPAHFWKQFVFQMHFPRNIFGVWRHSCSQDAFFKVVWQTLLLLLEFIFRRWDWDGWSTRI